MERFDSFNNNQEFVDYISKKYNYNDKLKGFLNTIIDAMIMYYGDYRGDDIYTAFSETYIHIQEDDENADEYLTKYFGESYTFNTDSEIVKCANCSISTMNDGKISKKKIIYITNHFSDIDLNKEDVYSDYSFQVLIHELNHSIKNNWNGRVLSDNEFEIATGLNHTVFSTVNTPYDIVSDKYEFIEEAINTIQEYDLFTLITNRSPVAVNVYRNIQDVMTQIIDKFPNLYGEIVNSEFNHSEEWLDYIGKENADTLDELFKKDVMCCSRGFGYEGLYDESQKIVNNIARKIKDTL